MMLKTPVLWLALLVSLLLVGSKAPADERPGKHKHDHKTPLAATAADHAHHGHGHHHQHDKWENPPAEYAGARSTRWEDPAAIARGQHIYQTYCVACHGADGQGTGPAAGGLAHPPADMTNHFHMKPGDGDAYLFWRVSEGGTVEPFKSIQSAMPAFKTILSEDQRWDVLAYVHATFHHGFKSEGLVTAEGKVIAVVPASQQLVVQHGKIDGFMDAMTMGYKVQPPSLLQNGLKAGDIIRFTIDKQEKAIVEIEQLRQ